MYEFFEHTADIGLRVRAPTLEALFADAARGLTAILVENPAAVQPEQSWTFSVEADGLDNLLHDWLDELLFAFHARHMVCAEFDVRLSAGRLDAVVRGEAIDRTRHEIGVEIKAITYHGLTVRQDAEGWLAELIVDI